MGHQIVTKYISCGYNGKPVLTEISFTISGGENVCILGPNGVGKTTLFKTMLGLLKPLGGEISFNGRSRSEYSVREMAQTVAYVPQAHHPPFPYTALEVVTLGRTAYMGLFATPRKEDVRIAQEMMEMLGIEHLRNSVFTQMSGGEKQMVLIARALAQKPSFLIMDEPTSNLDFGNQAEVLSCINQLVENGLGVLMTTHNPDHAFLSATQVLLLFPDKTYKIGSCQDVLTPENMRIAYGIETSVGTLSTLDGRKVITCAPVLN